VSVACREIDEGHLERAADPGIQMMDLAGKAVRRKPLRHRFRIEESTIYALRIDTEHAKEPYGASGHG
jgi:hypothetical protein